jgi:peptidoglycan hydrolase-like protein with peptidoglycan-binding domain
MKTNLEKLINEALRKGLDDLVKTIKAGKDIPDKTGRIADLEKSIKSLKSRAESPDVSKTVKRSLKADIDTLEDALGDLNKSAADRAVAAAKAEQDATVAKKVSDKSPSPKFENAESQKLADKINNLKRAGATEDNIKPLRDELLKKEGLTPVEVDDISKRLQKLQSEYDTAVKTGGEDSPRAIKIKKEMEKLNGVTNFTRIKRFCGKDYKRGGLCLAILGAAGFAAYKEVNSLIDPDSESAKPRDIEGGGYAWKSCPDTLLKVGCRGENVRRMQQKLVDCGFSLPKYGVDGKFKYETKATVIQFQKANKLKVDGIAGVETLQALENCGLSGKPASTTEQPASDTFTVDPQQPAYRRMGDDQDYYVTPSGGAVNIPGKPYSTNSMEGDEYEGGVKKIKESKLYTHNKLIKERNERIEKLVFERMVKNANRL